MQRVRSDAGPLKGFPDRFEDEPLLRVHRGGLPRADPEEFRIEIGRVGKESALPHISGVRSGRVGVEELFQIPSAVVREIGDDMPAIGNQMPQFLRGIHSARIAAANSDNDDGLVVGGAGRQRLLVGLGGDAEQRGPQAVGQVPWGRVVEGEGHRQVEAGGGNDPGVQVDPGQRVEAQLAEGEPRVHPVGVVPPVPAQDRLRLGADKVGENTGLFSGRHAFQPAGQCLRPSLPGRFRTVRKEATGLAHLTTPRYPCNTQTNLSHVRPRHTRHRMPVPHTDPTPSCP